MKTEHEIRTEINRIKQDYKHVLKGSRATIAINAPRALLQLSSETHLAALGWVLGEQFKSKLKGVNR